MMCEVLRAIPGADGRVYQPGEEVDVTLWKHADKLIDQRYLRLKPRKASVKKETVIVAELPTRHKRERVLD